MRVVIAGEGTCELGTNGPPEGEPDEPGVLQALLGKLCKDVDVVEKIKWCGIAKLRPDNPGLDKAEKKNVDYVVQQAREREADAVAFVRDRDEDKERQRIIEHAITEAEAREGSPRIAGGVAIERIESWIAALLKKTKTEKAGNKTIDDFLHGKGIEKKDWRGMIRVAQKANVEQVPEDAESLRKWIERARLLASL